MPEATILFVLTSHNKLGDTGEETGFHLEEMTTPYYALKDASFDIEIASIQGGLAPIDPSSLKTDPQDNPPSVQRYLNDPELKQKVANTFSVHTVNSLRYDGIYLPGGHGTMWDFPESESLKDIIEEMHRDRKIIAAICHGPAAFVHVRDVETGDPLIQGRNINSFTDAEEREAGKDEVVPFLLESKLRERGARFQSSGPFKNFTIQDGNLITGQNPASAESLSQKMISALRQKSRMAA